MPVQSEVEYIAIETLGSRGNIYFDSIPLTAFLYLKWDDKLRGWEIRHKSGEEKMTKTFTIPSKEIRTLIESHIINKLKIGIFKWVMEAGNNDYPCVGDVKIEWEENHG